MRAWLEDSFDDFMARFRGPGGTGRARRWCRGPVALLGLLALCAAVYVPGLVVLPVVDRDEARFAQASRQMAESRTLPEAQRVDELHGGGLVVPRLGAEPRLNKPPLIYWLQAGSARLWTGGDLRQDAIWMYRLPSVLCALLAVLACWRAGCAMFDERAGLLGAVLLAVCPMIAWDATQARADQLLLACTTAAFWLLGSLCTARRLGPIERWAVPIGFWLAVAFGVLAKGPIAPMIAALAVVCASLLGGRWRWLRTLRPLTGLAVLAAVVVPWMIAVANRVGWGEYWSVVAGETLGRAAAPTEGHWGPPGYHLALLVVLFWPGVLLTAAALGRAVSRGLPPRRRPARMFDEQGEEILPPLRQRVAAALRRRAGRRGELFCLCWILPAWILFELFSTKLPHYTLPLYPAIALLTARALLAASAGSLGDLDTFGARLGFLVWLGVGIALSGVFPAAVIFLGGPPWAIGATLPLAALGAWMVVTRVRPMLRSSRLVVAQLWSVAAAVVAAWTILQVALPHARSLWITERLVARVEAAGQSIADRPVAAEGYHEDSLLYATRGRLVRLGEGEGVAWLRRTPGGLLVASADLAATAEAVGEVRKLGRDVRGFNYAAGRFEQLAVYELAR